MANVDEDTGELEMQPRDRLKIILDDLFVNHGICTGKLENTVTELVRFNTDVTDLIDSKSLKALLQAVTGKRNVLILEGVTCLPLANFEALRIDGFEDVKDKLKHQQKRVTPPPPADQPIDTSVEPSDTAKQLVLTLTKLFQTEGHYLEKGRMFVFTPMEGDDALDIEHDVVTLKPSLARRVQVNNNKFFIRRADLVSLNLPDLTLPDPPSVETPHPNLIEFTKSGSTKKVVVIQDGDDPKTKLVNELNQLAADGRIKMHKNSAYIITVHNPDEIQKLKVLGEDVQPPIYFIGDSKKLFVSKKEIDAAGLPNLNISSIASPENGKE